VVDAGTRSSAQRRDRRGPGAAFWLRAAAALAARPRLWPVAMTQGTRLVPRDWWRHRPYLPLPDPEYMRFRFETQYGPDPLRDRVDPHDLIDYLAWCRDVARWAHRARTPR
jgi:hypothetical protein